MAIFDTVKKQPSSLAGVGELIKAKSASPLVPLGQTMVAMDKIIKQRAKDKYSAEVGAKLAGINTLEGMSQVEINPAMANQNLMNLVKNKNTILVADKELNLKQKDTRMMMEAGYPLTPEGYKAFKQASLSEAKDGGMSGYPNTYKEWMLSGQKEPYADYLANYRSQLVTTRDADGNETTVVLPRGATSTKPVAGANKTPKISATDIATSKEIPMVDEMFAEFDALIPTQEQIDSGEGDASGFGVIDAMAGKGAGLLGINTEKSKDVQEIDTYTSKVMGILGKQEMKGVLSDQDLKFIRQTIPNSFDSEQQARTKLNQIKKLWTKSRDAYNSRIKKTHPQYDTGDAPVVDNTTTAQQTPETLPNGNILYKGKEYTPDGALIK